jgi:hypothetical protein
MPATDPVAPSPVPTVASFQWDRYVPRSLHDLTELVDAELPTMGNGDVYIETSPYYQYPSRVGVIYTGEVRTTSDGLQMVADIFLNNYAPQLAQEERSTFLDQQVLFREGAADYWLAVQAPLLIELGEAVQADGPVTLFIIFAGASKQAGELERLYVVNGF